MKTKTETLAAAMDVLAREIQSGDGVANAAIAEAADRLRELERKLNEVNLLLDLARNDRDINLEKLKAGKSYKTRNLMVVPLATQEALRQKGWRLWTDNAYSAWAPNKAFDDVSAAGFDASMVVDLRHDCHMMFDYNGNPLPVGVEFNYISHGMISNGRYDLEKLAKHLLSRSDCKIYKRNERRSDVETATYATTVKDAIVDVPYYNMSNGCSRTIYFIWQPNAADYARMWDWCLANNKKYPSTDMHRAVFELDLIGARAAGAALFDEYYKSTEYEEDRNDYDTSDED